MLSKLIIAFFLAITVQQSVAIDISVNGTVKYVVIPQKRTWGEAFTDCTKNLNTSNVRLATFETQEEMVSFQEAFSTTPNMLVGSYWTSARQLLEGAEWKPYWEASAQHVGAQIETSPLQPTSLTCGTVSYPIANTNITTLQMMTCEQPSSYVLCEFN